MSILTTLKTATTTLYHEFSSPLFDTIEPCYTNTVEKRKYRNQFSLSKVRSTSPRLDVVVSFCPRPLWAVLPIKFVLMIGVVAVSVLDVLFSEERSVFWLAYFGNLGWCLVCLYYVCSFGCCAGLVWRPREEAGWLVKGAWAFFAVSLPSQIIITLMHYLLQFDGTFSYTSLIMNGGAIPLLLIDGMLINRIPLRMKQFHLFQSFVFLYLVWTVGFAYSGMINPYNEQDTIYEWLDWKNDAASAILLALFVLVLLNPAVFVMCRAVSRILPRRLLTKSLDKDAIGTVGTKDAQDEVDVTHDIEEGDGSYANEIASNRMAEKTTNEEPAPVSKFQAYMQNQGIEDLASFPDVIYDNADVAVSLSSYNDDETTQASSQKDTFIEDVAALKRATSTSEETRASSQMNGYIGDVAEINRASHTSEDTSTSMRINAFIGDIATSTNTDEYSIPAYTDDDDDADYTFDKEGHDMSFDRRIEAVSREVDLVSFPDILAP